MVADIFCLSDLQALESFHEWERELQEDEELRIISERSRKETRHDRSVSLAAGQLIPG